MLEVREGVVEDASAIAALYVRTRQVGYAPFHPAEVLAAMSVEEETARWRERLSEAASTTLVLARGAELYGFSHLAWHDGTEGEVEYMYVATEHQGGGLGRRLMSEAEARLAAGGATTAVLWVYEGNSAARGFYERCGWSADGGMRESTSAPGTFLLRYRKALR